MSRVETRKILRILACAVLRRRLSDSRRLAASHLLGGGEFANRINEFYEPERVFDDVFWLEREGWGTSEAVWSSAHIILLFACPPPIHEPLSEKGRRLNCGSLRRGATGTYKSFWKLFVEEVSVCEADLGFVGFGAESEFCAETPAWLLKVLNFEPAFLSLCRSFSAVGI